MNANRLVMLANNVNYLTMSQGKPDITTMQHAMDGRATKITLDAFKKDQVEVVNYFLKGELGQIKLKIVTGQILDYKA
jgi:hypothetical protein